MRIRKLYSLPEIFRPLEFSEGLNLILGERSDTSNKTNGVGKSICIEFLNFCLLKRSTDSRVMKIPQAELSENQVVYLDVEIGSQEFTIERSVKESEKVAITREGLRTEFETLDDASQYLGNLLLDSQGVDPGPISLRSILGPIIRDEKSEFKDIIRCYDTEKRIPADYSPHLFFLGLEVGLYREIKEIIETYNKKTAFASETKKLITRNGELKLSDARARLNELEFEVRKINSTIEELKVAESFESLQDELVELESLAASLRSKQKAIRFELAQIRRLPELEVLSDQEIEILFNRFVEGLGTQIRSSLEEMKTFKLKIDRFRNQIVNEKQESLRQELSAVESEIRKIDEKYSSTISLVDKGKLLSDLKTSVNVYSRKNEELNNLRSLIDTFDVAENEKKTVNATRSAKLTQMDSVIFRERERIREFERTILDAHEFIIGNREAHFGVRTQESSQSKDVINFDLRIDDDGSWSTERLKVFLYDIALLTSEVTRSRHPRFLIHDNIFNVDTDSLEKCLNYLHLKATTSGDFQYILTLNRDMVETMEERRSLSFSINDYRRAFFTKQNRFLNIKYVERD